MPKSKQPKETSPSSHMATIVGATIAAVATIVAAYFGYLGARSRGTSTSESAAVAVRVVDRATRRPIHGATVNIYGSTDPVSKRTNREGMFMLLPPSSGLVRLLISADGYEEYDQSLDAWAARQTSNVELTRSSSRGADLPASNQASDSEQPAFKVFSNVPAGSVLSISTTTDSNDLLANVRVVSNTGTSVIWGSQQLINQTRSLQLSSAAGYAVSATIAMGDSASSLEFEAAIKRPDGSLFGSPFRVVLKGPKATHHLTITIAN